MTRALGVGLLALGILLLVAGMAAPATDTHRSVTCVDSTYGADGCVEATYQTPNFGKGAMIATGLATAVVGGGVLAFGGDSGRSPASTASLQGEDTLASELRERDDEDAEKSGD